MYNYYDVMNQLSKNNIFFKMKERDINKIHFRNDRVKPRVKYDRIKPIIGVDTETKNGKCFVIGMYSDKNFFHCRTRNYHHVINFLISKLFRNNHNFFWNISYDFQAIIKLLPYKKISEIAQHNETYINLKVKNYTDKKIKISYIPNKCFKLSYDKKCTTFWDIAQYYNKISLDNASKKYLNNEGKLSLKDHGIDIANLDDNEYDKNYKYSRIINKYLELDCKYTKQLAQKIYDISLQYMKPKYFYSQASLSQQYFLENLKNVMYQPPKKVMQYANYSYQGGRFETIRRGHFKKSCIYDIKSAYPYETVKIPDTGRGRWKIGYEYDEDALLSLMNVNYEFPEELITPTKAVNPKSGGLYFPYGTFQNVFINKTEYETLSKFTDINIIKAYHYYDKDPYYPYMFIKDFYDLKESLKKEGKKDLALFPKTVINGFYGKTIQQVEKLHAHRYKKEDNTNFYDYDYKFNKKTGYYDEFFIYKEIHAGMLYNSVVANEITANTRMKLFNMAYKHKKHLIGMQTDSLILSKDVEIIVGNKLGDWDLEEKNKETVILGSGVYSLKDGRNKMRGLQRGMDLFKVLKDNPFEENILLDVTRNNKLKKTFNSVNIYPTEELRLKAFNLIIKESKNFSINFDTKRKWDRNFLNSQDVFNNVINSSPLSV